MRRSLLPSLRLIADGASFTSWIGVSVTCATLAGLLTAGLLRAVLPAESLNSWGWRIPFLLALPLGLVGLYIRLKLDESPAFKLAREAKATFSSPLPEVLGKASMYRRMGVTALLGLGAFLGYYMIMMVYMPTLLTSELGFKAGDALFAICIGGAAIVVLGPVMGGLSRQIRSARRAYLRVRVPDCAAIPQFPAAQHRLLSRGRSSATVASGAGLGRAGGLRHGRPGTLSHRDRDPGIRHQLQRRRADRRYGGFCLGMTSSSRKDGSIYAPAFYLIAVAVAVLVTTLRVPETASRRLEVV